MIMSIKFNYLFYIYTLFFFSAVFYWFPFVSTNLISSFKFFNLLLVFVFFIVFKRYSLLKGRQLGFAILVLLWALIYQIISSNDFFYFNTISLIVFFYFMGKCITYPKYKYNSIYAYLFVFFFSWVFLSYFITQLDFRNSLLLEYEYAEVMLSSTGFGLGRTGWGIAVYFVTLFFMSFTKSNYLKTAIFLMGFLNVCTTGSRAGMLYFSLSVLVFANIYLKSTGKRVFVSFLFLLFIFAFLNFFGEILRFSNVEDFSNGRFLQYDVVYELVGKNILMGNYSYGGYSLEDMGFEYKQIHNAWLNFFIKYGVIGFIPLLVFFMYSLFQAFTVKKLDKEKVYMYLIVICGFFSTFFEPETIFSYGYHVLIFWFCLGYLAKDNRNI